ncbi:hypothetical protein GFS24_03430 [Chitinophaga sp. SYP-B3965]|uniref:hypothetical protein n=1 Tax=Chitinophaga sp. SYP-B3965 TaxID=2663120 RepID=UPI0012999712|nr:hypothetical protein [Chitinophaga sp. SYP-B3965]MRG44147.1 hypothetical protein [Chitinophaga sp. SYP-B3965]
MGLFSIFSKKINLPYKDDGLNEIYESLFTSVNAAEPGKKEILAVIIEVGLKDGLDVLAVYQDGTARYINHAEKLLVWEAQTPVSQQLISELLAAGEQAVAQIGPWDKERRLYPVKGMARLTFLVSDGFYFGEAPFHIFQNDPIGGPVIAAGARLMLFLTQQHA